uniref:Sorting nexin 31 n=1 Tax=Leptobrachium leishanense TaxID=445787 RepID=A0A8C5Q6Q3_9ANUR
MHINIPVTEEVQDSLGARFVLHRVFGNLLPTFPPKYFLAMTNSMAEERRLQLEQYLQQLVSDPVISNSEIFIDFIKKLQMETFKMPTVDLILKVYLPDGTQIKVDALTMDTAEQVLKSALYKIGLSRELMEYFSLFITHREYNGDITVVKQIADFELPFITIWNMDGETFQIDIRKCYMNPATDAMLMGCTTAIHLLYVQAVQEFTMNWSRPTDEQRQKLQHLLEAHDEVKFLHLIQEVESYGHVQLRPCTSNYPEPGTSVTVSVGYVDTHCCFQTSNGNQEILQLRTSAVTCWNVQMCQSDTEDAGVDSKHHLEFTFEYNQGETKQCITLRTDQAFLLSTCLKKILFEQPVVGTKEAMEIQVERKTIFSKKFNQKHKPSGDHGKEVLLSKTMDNVVFDGFTDINL